MVSYFNVPCILPANRDLQREVSRSFLDYWMLASRIKLSMVRFHDVSKPVDILGMKVYRFSLFIHAVFPDGGDLCPEIIRLYAMETRP